MPRGRPKHHTETKHGGTEKEVKEVQEAKPPEIQEKPETQEEVKPEGRRMEPTDMREQVPVSYPDYIAESRKALENPLPLGQKFFESPEGEIIIGEDSKMQVWSRRMNGGKGGWVNPRR